MKPTEKLDYILNVMNKMFVGHYVNLTDIAKYSEIIDKININELPGILDKLVKDGYADFGVDESQDTIYQSDKKYTITFEGKNLIETGGYKEKIRRATTSTNLQLAQTWAIAIGTALAGLYGLYELIKALLHLSCL